MDKIAITSITALDIRRTITEFLQQRLNNNASYKTESAKLAKAEADNDIPATIEAKQKLTELTQRFDFELWMEDALTKRISWLQVATHLSKGIHPSSKASNVNYNSQNKAKSEYWVSSATVDDLPYDASGSAAALDIFGLLNQTVNNSVKILDLINANHLALNGAFSDDEQKNQLYLNNLKQLLNDNWDTPQASELNKQIFWPNGEQPYLSDQFDSYRLLIPLHPSSLCHIVYQKVQSRFSDTNRLAREQRYKKNVEQQAYFSLHDLAVIRLGGSNAQNASQLIGSQMGRNFLLPSIPPKISDNRIFGVTRRQTTLFNNRLKWRCYFGFERLFAVIEANKSIKPIREQRKEAFQIILALILKTVKQIQMSYPAGWSELYQLDMNQKYWLDPRRCQLPDQQDFILAYQKGDWINELEKQFARWIQDILKQKFNTIALQFNDSEWREWRREFHSAVKASQRKKEGVF